MAAPGVRLQNFRPLVSHKAQRPTMTTLYRGTINKFRFFTDEAAQRFDLLDRKYIRVIEPSYFDKFLCALTRKPIWSPDEHREFFSLHSIAGPQSFSDNRQVAESYAGPKGYLSMLSLPFHEALGFMQIRALYNDDHTSPENVFFIPALELTKNLRSGHWMFATKQLGMDGPAEQ